MNAAIQPLAAAAQGAARESHLRAPFAHYSPDELLAHFRARRGVEYFTVPDPHETQRAKIDAIVAGHFEFNHETHTFSGAPSWLQNPSADIEWHILLHKFYYATGLGMAYAETREPRYLARWIELTDSWMAVVPPGFIANDVTGRRVQNWIYAYYYFVATDATAPVPAEFHARLLRSIALQVDHLCANLTPKRNHRTLELYAIFLAGVVFPEFAHASEWREFALRELAANARADLLADGVHCELSTDYHHLVVKNYLAVLRLAALNQIPVAQEFDAQIARALDFSMHVHKPDGIVPSLSDGDARSFVDLLRQGHELFGRRDWLYVATSGREGVPPAETAAAFPSSGYYVMRSGWGRGRVPYRDEQYLVFDCGPLGEGNHGHFDCLSFELAANGRSLIVDPGRYTYSEAGEINWRIRFRSTSAHNTITVDGCNQTRYTPRKVDPNTRHQQGSVRHRISGPPPAAECLAFGSTPRLAYVCGAASSSVEAGHEYSARHERHIALIFGSYWIIFDSITAPEAHSYDQRFQLSEQAEGHTRVRAEGGNQIVECPGLALHLASVGAESFELEPAFVSYQYGVKLPAPRVRATRSAARAQFHTLLLPGVEDSRGTTLRVLPVSAPEVRAQVGAAPVDVATAIEVRHANGERDLILIAEPTAENRGAWHCLAVRSDSQGRLIESARIAGGEA